MWSDNYDNADDEEFIEPTALEDLQQAITVLTNEHEKMVNFKEGDDLNALLFSNRVGTDWAIRLLQSAHRELIEQLGES